MNLIDGIKNGTLQKQVDWMEKQMPGRARPFVAKGLVLLHSTGAITAEQRDSGFRQLGLTEEEIQAAVNKTEGKTLS